MDFSLLRNKTYLILLAYYNGQKMPTYTALGDKAGITRQTATKHVAQLQKDNLLQIDQDIVYINNVLDIDVNILKDYLDNTLDFNPIELKQKLFYNSTESQFEIGKSMGMSREFIYRTPQAVVYGIISEGKLKYVGTTKYFEDRIKEHIKKRPYLEAKDFVILMENVGEKNYNFEKELIHLLDPEWNQVGKSI